MNKDQILKTKLLDDVRARIRARHFSIRTEKTYSSWIKRYIKFHNMTHPKLMGKLEIEQYLTFLATKQQVAASTQNQALSALLFLYRDVLNQPLKDELNIVRASRSNHIPVVFTKDEVHRLLNNLTDIHWLLATLIYGSGMRIRECLRLRIKDIDIQSNQIIIRDGKGYKDRVTILPQICKPEITRQITYVKTIHEQDIKQGLGSVHMPFALARKYPNAKYEFISF